jgi:hypothetical protein
MKHEPGTYPLNAKFYTSRGLYVANPVILVVTAPAQPNDSGHIVPAVVVAPNPCPLNANYAIDYQITNTTGSDVTVLAINADVGPLDPQTPGWISGRAGSHMTTVIARVRGKASVAGTTVKIAAFFTSQGVLVAQPKDFTVR